MKFLKDILLTNGALLRIKETAAPSTPSADTAVIYLKTDGKLYMKNEAGTEYDLTAAGVSAHNALSGLTSGDDHTQYALLAGRTGGQTLIGGTGSGNNLTLSSTSHATKGKIIFGASSLYDQVNDTWGIGATNNTVFPLQINRAVNASTYTALSLINTAGGTGNGVRIGFSVMANGSPTAYINHFYTGTGYETALNQYNTTAGTYDNYITLKQTGKIRFDTYAGSGSRLMYLDASEDMQVAAIDPVNLLVQGNNNLTTPLVFDGSTNHMEFKGDLRLPSLATSTSDRLVGLLNSSGSLAALALGGGLLLSANTLSVKSYVLVNNVTPVGNVGGGTDDLMTYSLPAGQLATNTDFITFEMVFDTNINSNSKQIDFSFGTDAFGVLAALSAAGGGIIVRGTISRLSATTQLIDWTMTSTNNGTLSGVFAGSQTLSGAITLKAQGTAVATDDIIQKRLTVVYHKV